MSSIGRSEKKLYQTRGRPVYWLIALVEPDKSATDLTGKTITAELNWGAGKRALSIEMSDPVSGKFSVNGPASLSAEIPVCEISKLIVRITDSTGAGLDFVWPVLGDEP